MRIAMNTLMISKWRSLGNYQSRYVPGMIGPFLKVSLIPHTGTSSNSTPTAATLLTVCVCVCVCAAIRRATIPIFFDMMENEFKYRKNFHMVCKRYLQFSGCVQWRLCVFVCVDGDGDD